jgi:DNA excision repair protein ERCC-1
MNPYAKKKPPFPGGDSSTLDTANEPRRPSAAGAPAGERNSGALGSPATTRVGNTLLDSLASAAPATLTQAFPTVKTTAEYQREILRHSSSKTGRDEGNEQSGLGIRGGADQAASTSDAATSLNGNEAGKNKWTDRDHHVLLQQPHVLYVSLKQEGNPLLSYIRNVPVQYATMIPDYILSPTRCALFLSCKYHNLYPQYIHRRIAELRTDFTLRILLVLVDLEDNANLLLYLNKLCVVHSLTLVLSWSEEEAARYLETYKALDGKDTAALLQKKESTQFTDQVIDFFTATSRSGGGTSVNKTDSLQLLAHFSSIRSVAAASQDELGLVPGIGPIKCQRLHDALHKPFVSNRRKRLVAEQKQNFPDKRDDTGSIEGKSSKDKNQNADEQQGKEAGNEDTEPAESLTTREEGEEVGDQNSARYTKPAES